MGQDKASACAPSTQGSNASWIIRSIRKWERLALLQFGRGVVGNRHKRTLAPAWDVSGRFSLRNELSLYRYSILPPYSVPDQPPFDLYFFKIGLLNPY